MNKNQSEPTHLGAFICVDEEIEHDEKVTLTQD